MTKKQFFLRSALPDFLLVLVASVCLSLTVSYGFESAAAFRGNPLVHVAVAVPLLLILFAGGWSKKAVAPSAVGAVAFSAVVVGASAALMPSETPLFVDAQINDVADNYVIFAFVVIIVPVLTYLLSRRKVGVLVLLLAGVLSFELIQYLYKDWVSAQPGTIIALIGMVALFSLMVFQGYRANLYAATRVKQASFGAAAGFGVLTSCLCMLVGVAAFVVVIGNLGLSTPDIKPFQDYYVRPVVEYSGVYSQQQVEDPDQTTDQTNNQMNDSNQEAEGGSQSQQQDDTQDQGSNPLNQAVQFMSSFDVSNWNAAFNAISYEQLALGFSLIALLVVAAVVAAILIKRYTRALRLKKLQDKDYSYRIWALYDFLVKRMQRLGIKRPEQLTLLEYAMASRTALLPFAQGTGGVDFLAVTLAYQRACYANKSATKEDYEAVERFYNAFFQNAKTYAGKKKWILKFWVI